MGASSNAQRTPHTSPSPPKRGNSAFITDRNGLKAYLGPAARVLTKKKGDARNLSILEEDRGVHPRAGGGSQPLCLRGRRVISLGCRGGARNLFVFEEDHGVDQRAVAYPHLPHQKLKIKKRSKPLQSFERKCNARNFSGRRHWPYRSNGYGAPLAPDAAETIQNKQNGRNPCSLLNESIWAYLFRFFSFSPLARPPLTENATP